MLRSLITCSMVIFVLGCGSSNQAATQEYDDLMGALMAAASQLRESAKPQQEAFEKEIVVGISKEEVKKRTKRIAENAEENSRERTYATGEMQISSDGDLVCFKNGEPDSKQTELGSEIEIWTYKCHRTLYHVHLVNDIVTEVNTENN